MATRLNGKQTRKSAEIVDEIDGFPLYPQHCFKLSPTVNTYPHLRASDIDALTTHSGFHGQNLFFHLNHPIQWVRIAGIVVAVDEYPGRRIYTVDDSSGVCIECLVDVPRADAALTAAVVAAKVDSKTDHKSNLAIPAPKRIVPEEVDVGTVIDVKGGLSLFRGNKQIKILKATILRSTEQEVAFWEKVRKFRRDVLEKPWQLTDKEVRRCRKEEERRK
ncbi:hypothetical protein N0V93_002412 [Gnomoniopsis smithogilvyi]|uniref:CST complex subunit Stn1 N-terminal domain-containing protein n=1 Tax=Gnomoniopsis smithogilvyi TaxID=1191159 RepID=A0A9W8YWE9_9PEZI|nr:hypothetical protein N0V93_002412 [Gnomoniopsis smithogilvyi]